MDIYQENRQTLRSLHKLSKQGKLQYYNFSYFYYYLLILSRDATISVVLNNQIWSHGQYLFFKLLKHMLKAPVCAVLDVFIHLSTELTFTLSECKGTGLFHVRQFNLS